MKKINLLFVFIFSLMISSCTIKPYVLITYIDRNGTDKPYYKVLEEKEKYKDYFAGDDIYVSISCNNIQDSFYETTNFYDFIIGVYSSNQFDLDVISIEIYNENKDILYKTKNEEKIIKNGYYKYYDYYVKSFPCKNIEIKNQNNCNCVFVDIHFKINGQEYKKRYKFTKEIKKRVFRTVFDIM
ncbi:MAG: hypothetical protein HUJ68_08095 [Clostridia bacterium]|nr:hypothetical protein [Clostridia bacterium]